MFVERGVWKERGGGDGRGISCVNTERGWREGMVDSSVARERRCDIGCVCVCGYRRE